MLTFSLASATPENVVEIRRAIDHMDVRQYMPMVKTPTLVIHSRNESLNPVAQGRLIAASIPGAEFLEIDSNNHVPPAVRSGLADDHRCATGVSGCYLITFGFCNKTL